MTKKRTNITLDPGIYKKAKSEGINVSRVTEKALKRYINRLEEADTAESELFNKLLDETKPASKAKRAEQTPKDFLEEFRRSCQVDWNLAESTTTQRMRYAKKLVDFLGGHPLEAEKGQLRRFIQNFGGDSAVKTVRVIYGRYFDTDLAKDFRVPQTEPTPKEVPGRSEMKKIYKQLKTPALRAAFLVLATSGLRRGEVMELRPSQLNKDKRTIYPPREKEKGATKRQWVTFYNHEVEGALARLNVNDMDPGEPIFSDSFCPQTLTDKLGEASERAGTIRTTPQTLRVWFADQMNRLRVSDRYIDAFCGRTPKSVLARHYTDFSPRRLREVYEEAGIEVLG